MELTTGLDLASRVHRSVLVTLRGDGRPQLSNVLHQRAGDGELRISTTTERAKYANLSRRPWAALHVASEDFWAYAVLEGEVELSAPAAQPDDATVEELVDYYRSLSGEHDDWPAYRRAMVAEHRVVVRLHPQRAYGNAGASS
ncbi:MAG TPA: PPOX class F420-dependent oxidoreductase [Acidimicrobiales bacterium]|nr:PPOX class F420-dependent oxidoreductase [Acidimicrobiales bacterium]